MNPVYCPPESLLDKHADLEKPRHYAQEPELYSDPRTHYTSTSGNRTTQKPRERKDRTLDFATPSYSNVLKHTQSHT